MKRWTVYCHTHTESGRRYVGVTSQTWEKRWKNHIHVAKSSKGGRWHFPNAIRKYGPTAFSHEVLGVYDSLEEANQIEKEKIEEWDLRNPKKGFNLAPGGQHSPHPIRKNPWNNPEYRAKQTPRLIAMTHTPQAKANHRTAVRTPEYRAKQSEIQKQITSSPEVRARMSAIQKAAHQGRVYGPEFRKRMATMWAGRKHSQKSIDKIRAANMGNKHTLGKTLSEEHKEKIRKALKLKSKEISSKNKKYVEKDGVMSKMCDVHGLVSADECLIYVTKGVRKVYCKACRKMWGKTNRNSADPIGTGS